MTILYLLLLILFIVINYFIKCNDNTNIKKIKMNNVFNKIYSKGIWGNGSGPGSYRKCTVGYLKFLDNFISVNNITSMVDIGCGDWQILKYFNLSSNIKYYGYDIVDSLIERNNVLYRKENIQFIHVKSFKDKLYPADLIMSKDVLQHWENSFIKEYLTNILWRYKYAIIVNDYRGGYKNRDIKTGDCRPLNLENNPFNYKNFKYHYDMKFCNTLKRIYIKMPLV